VVFKKGTEMVGGWLGGWVDWVKWGCVLGSNRWLNDADCMWQVQPSAWLFQLSLLPRVPRHVACHREMCTGHAHLRPQNNTSNAQFQLRHYFDPCCKEPWALSYNSVCRQRR